jgi:molybdate transport repressor ModE-like protein
VVDLEVRHFRLIEAIAQTGSITKAAAMLGVSQPALTAQLQRIERRVGGPLFHRDRLGSHPTALGEVVLTHARAVLATVSGLDRSVRQQRTGTPTVVRIAATAGTITSEMTALVPAVIPGATVELRVAGDRATQLELLADGRLELVVCQEAPGHEIAMPAALDKAAIATEPLFVGVGAGSPLAAREEVELWEVAGTRWFTAAITDDWFAGYVRAVCLAHGVPTPELQSLDLEIAAELTAMGGGVMLLQAASRARPGVVCRPLAGAPIQTRHLIVWSKEGPLAAADVQELMTQATTCYWDKAPSRQPIYAQWLHRHGRLPLR